MVQVFTTCGSAAKKAVLLERFPQLDADNIGDSRSTSFEQLVMQAVSCPASDCPHPLFLRQDNQFLLPGSLLTVLTISEVALIRLDQP
jgi:hypothetical protein